MRRGKSIQAVSCDNKNQYQCLDQAPPPNPFTATAVQKSTVVLYESRDELLREGRYGNDQEKKTLSSSRG
jgi:hypothetical protein